MSDDNIITNGIPAIIEAARAEAEAEVLDVAGESDLNELFGLPFSGVPMLITRDASGKQSAASVLPEVEAWRKAYAPAPMRRRGTIEAHTLASFVDAVNRDKRPDTVLFADVPARRLVAVLDFHGVADCEPRFLEDRVGYSFQLSPQIDAWVRASQATMDQKTFARLIDDRAGEVGEGPFADGSIASEFARRRGIRFASVADLLVFTRTISAKSTTESEEIRDENTGDVSIQFKKRGDVKSPDGAPIAVPAAFVLTIPILAGIGAAEFNIPCRLRYDIGEKGIAWKVELHALEKFIQAAVEEAVERVRLPAPEGCGLPVYLAAVPPAA